MNTMSPLRTFRTTRQIKLDALADALGVHKTTAMRIETGALAADADIVERIVLFTDGAVTADDLHAVRLEWLRANRPEKFEPAPSEAA